MLRTPAQHAIIKTSGFFLFPVILQDAKKGKAFWKHIVLGANKTDAQYELLWKCLASSGKQKEKQLQVQEALKIKNCCNAQCSFFTIFFFPMEKCYLYLPKTHGLPECHPSFPLFLTNGPSEKILPQLQIPRILLSDGTQ